MRHEDIEACFTCMEGGYNFARWGRPIAPVVFGVQDHTLHVIKEAVQVILLWSKEAFAKRSALVVRKDGRTVVRPKILRMCCDWRRV